MMNIVCSVAGLARSRYILMCSKIQSNDTKVLFILRSEKTVFNYITEILLNGS